MAAITATAWTLTVNERTIEGKKKRNRVVATISATQDLTYPSSGGIPLPTTPSDWGMVRNLDYIHVYSPAFSASLDVMWKYLASDHALRGYGTASNIATGGSGGVRLSELATTWKPSLGPGGNVFYVEAVGW